MESRGAETQELHPEDFEAYIAALKWIAALSSDPFERVAAFRKVFELRNLQLDRQREQGAA